jgi:predicted RNA-binding Zn ribbon-like protein
MSLPDPKSPFEYTGGNLALDFANTVNNRYRENRTELLTDYKRLVQWSEGATVLTPKSADRLERLASQEPEKAMTTLTDAIELREAIHAIFSAVSSRRAVPVGALAMLNECVRTATEHAQITHGNRRFVWEWILPDCNLDSMLWPVARAASDLLTSDDLAYVRHCASDTCRWLFLDKTKNHRRRWCEMKTCGNRDKARRYYERQRAG